MSRSRNRPFRSYVATAAILLTSKDALALAPPVVWPKIFPMNRDSQHHPKQQRISSSSASSEQAPHLFEPTGRVAGLPGQIVARPFNLSQVTLNPSVHPLSNFSFAAQQLNVQYLLYLDPAHLLWNFRKIAGLPNVTDGPYGGWIGNGSLVAGHFTGHYLSATAFAVAATSDPATRAALLAKSASVVEGLAECQDHQCQANPALCGYVSGYNFAQIVALEEHTGPTWATYYTIHKIMAGLLDTYLNTYNDQALAVLLKMAAFFKKRIDAVIATKGWGWWEECLQVEFGGMNEVMYNLYAITNDTDHLQMATYFYKAVFMDPLARSQDALNNQHANTHLPEIIGIARGWEVTGNATLAYIAHFFYTTLSQNYTYATGGSNVDEHWKYPGELGNAIATLQNGTAAVNSEGFHTEESCTTYNALKIARHLFQWSGSAGLADDYEQKLVNGVLGIQKPLHNGTMVYMTPLGKGVSRPQANWNQGWGAPTDSFWCCYGTAIESFAKLGDSIYFHNDNSRTLWINQFVSSAVKWAAADLTLTQASDFTSDAKALVSRITLGAGPTSSRTTLAIRIPAWAVQASTTITLNGASVLHGPGLPGSFLEVTRVWKSGDVVIASFGMAPRILPINDVRPDWASVGAIMYGPFLLAGFTSQPSFALKADPCTISTWLRVKNDFTFTAPGWTLKPLSQVVDESYTAYFNISLQATG